MVLETETLRAMQIANAEEVVSHHSNDTSRRGEGFGNLIVQVCNGPAYSNVALLSCIFADNGTAESRVAAIQRTFREGRELLQHWHDITALIFPCNKRLLSLLPDPSRLTLARLAKHGFLMMDTCDTSRKFRRAFIYSESALGLFQKQLLLLLCQLNTAGCPIHYSPTNLIFDSSHSFPVEGFLEGDGFRSGVSRDCWRGGYTVNAVHQGPGTMHQCVVIRCLSQLDEIIHIHLPEMEECIAFFAAQLIRCWKAEHLIIWDWVVLPWVPW